MKIFEKIKLQYLYDRAFLKEEDFLTAVGYKNLPEEEKKGYIKTTADYYCKISGIPDISDTQLLFISQAEANGLLRTIKNCVVFFTVLTVISLLCGLFAILA